MKKNAPRTTSAIIALFAACGIVAGCSRTVENNVDERINATLPKYFGPAEKYETHIDIASDGALMRGRVRSVHVVGTKVNLRPDLTLLQVTVEAEAIEIDPKRHTLESVGSAAFTGTINADEINHYIQNRVTDVPGLSISFKGDRMTVHAKPDALGIIRVPVSVRGRLEPTPEGDHINFVPDGGSVSIIPVPRQAVEYLLRKVNPVVDLTKLPIIIHVNSVSIGDNAITMSGTIPPDEILKAADKRP